MNKKLGIILCSIFLALIIVVVNVSVIANEKDNEENKEVVSKTYDSEADTESTSNSASVSKDKSLTDSEDDTLSDNNSSKDSDSGSNPDSKENDGVDNDASMSVEKDSDTTPDNDKTNTESAVRKLANKVEYDVKTTSLELFGSPGDTTWQEDFDYTKDGNTLILNKYKGWYGGSENVVVKKTAQIDGVVYNVRLNNDCTKFFYDNVNYKTKSIEFETGFDTSNVTCMKDMFCRCEVLTSVDISCFDTSNVTDMRGMFSECSKLTSIDVSNFNTSNVTDMRGMFTECNGLTSLDVSNFNTSKVTDMQEMFGGCNGLTSLDVSNFNTSKVTDMQEMFGGCNGLTSLDVSNFDTSKVTDMGNMFAACNGLTSLDVSNFNTSKVTDMEYMFYSCSGLTSLDVSNFDTSNVTDMRWMFDECSGLTTLDLSSFDTSNVTNMASMFSDCSKLTSIDVSSFDTGNVKTVYRMFFGCSELTTLDLSGMNLENLNSGGMFNNENNLQRIEIPLGLSLTEPLYNTFVREDNPTEEYENLPKNKTTSFTIVRKASVVPVTGITIVPTNKAIDVGETFNITSTVAPDNATNKAVTYTSDKPEIATVDATGKVTGIAQGSAKVTVSTVDGGKTATCDVTVNNPIIPVIGLTITPKNYEIEVGDTFNIIATVTPADATNKNVTFVSDNRNVATVDRNGKVTGVGKGTATVTVTTVDGGKIATCQVTVVDTVKHVTGLTIEPTTKEIGVGTVFSIKPTVLPVDASNKSVIYRSDNQKVATVTNSGVVTGVSQGTATITVTTVDGGYTAKCVVKVVKKVKGLTIEPTNKIIDIGDTFKIISKIEPADATNKKITFRSNKPEIATVDETGKVTGVGKGNALIIATTEDGDYTATCDVTVRETIHVTGITVSPQTLALKTGEMYNLTATVYPNNATNKDVIWSTKNPNIATVNMQGKVTAKSVGTTSIVATTEDGGLSAECIVIVEEPKYKTYIIDNRSEPFDSDLITARLKNMTGDRYIIVDDSFGREITPLINEDSSISYTNMAVYDIRVTDNLKGGNDVTDFGELNMQLPLPLYMDLNSGSVSVVSILNGKLDKTIASYAEKVNGVDCVNFTTPHCTDFAILYTANNKAVDNNSSIEPFNANTFIKNKARARKLDAIPKTGKKK